MNDIEVFCSQQTHPNNILSHVLASFVGKVHYLLLITVDQMQMNDIEFFCRQQTHPNNVLLHVLASFAGKVPLFVAYCRWSVRTTSMLI